MTHPFSLPFAGSQPQRHRRLLLTLPAACALPVLSACGGGDADLSYDTEQALYVVDEAITPNIPHLSSSYPRPSGTLKPTFVVTTPLPDGLSLNKHTGVISGTPTKLKRQATYTIIATVPDVRGRAQTQLRITVTGKGAWTPAAAMPGARFSAAISPLPGGRFMVSGGVLSNREPTHSVEIYNPVPGTWTSAAPMPHTRELHMAVTLGNGRVLVMGGYAGSSLQDVAELYDPVANIWTATGRMSSARVQGTAHLLASGKVLVVGGYDSSYNVLNTAEVYDPATGEWSVLSTPLKVPRASHASALLPDGKTLLVVGGEGASTAELYKVNGSGTQEIPYGVLDVDHQAVTLQDGSVLVTSASGNQAKRFNPRTSSWTSSTLVNAGRQLATMVVLADGRVLLAGGPGLNTAEIYNPDVNRWTAAAPMAAKRSAAVAAVLYDGSVLVVGGLDPASGQHAETIVDASERYIP